MSNTCVHPQGSPGSLALSQCRTILRTSEVRYYKYGHYSTWKYLDPRLVEPMRRILDELKSQSGLGSD